MIVGLVEEIPDNSTQGAGENKGHPEKQEAGNRRHPVSNSDEDKQPAEDQGAPEVTESGGIGHPISQCGAKSLGEHDRHPVEHFGLGRANGIDRHRSHSAMPDQEGRQEQAQQKGRSSCLTDAKRSVGKVGKCGSDSRRGNDGQPVEEGVKSFGRDLGYHRRCKDHGEDACADEIAEIHRH